MAVAFQPGCPITDEQLERLSHEHPGVRFERSAQGELIAAPPLGSLGSYGESELTSQLRNWARREGGGRVSSSNGGFTFPDGSVLAPDAAWISQERWQALPKEARSGFARIAPNVVFELLSPSDSLAYARSKAATYLSNGVSLVVLLDPSSRLIELHRPTGISSHAHLDAVELDPELPGFCLEAAAIFDQMEEN